MCETLKTEGQKNLEKLLNTLKQNTDSYQQAKFRMLQDEFGLADAFNKEHFEVKLACVQEKEDSLCPEFFD